MKILIALALVVGLAALWGLACVVVPQWLGALISRCQRPAPSASATTDAYLDEQRSIAEAEQTLQEEREMHLRYQLEEALEAQRQSELEEQQSLALLMTQEHMA